MRSSVAQSLCWEVFEEVGHRLLGGDQLVFRALKLVPQLFEVRAEVSYLRAGRRISYVDPTGWPDVYEALGFQQTDCCGNSVTRHAVSGHELPVRREFGARRVLTARLDLGAQIAREALALMAVIISVHHERKLTQLS
jgi:hypothetical protein